MYRWVVIAVLLLSAYQTNGQVESGREAYETICTLYDSIWHREADKSDPIIREEFSRNIPIAKEWALVNGNDSAMAMSALIHWQHLSWKASSDNYDILVVGKELWSLRNALPTDDLLKALGYLSTLYQNTKRPADRLEVALEKCTVKKRIYGTELCDELAGVYHDLQQYETAIEYYRQDLELKKQQESWFQVASVLNNIGLAYRDHGKTELAEAHFTRSIGLLRSDTMQLSTVKPGYLSHFQNVVQWNLENVNSKEITPAKVRLASGLVRSGEEVTEFFWVLEGYLLLAQNDYEKGLLDRAILYADSALVFAKETKHMNSWIKALELKGKVLLLQGNRKDADYNFRRSSALADSVRIAEAALDANIAAAQFEARQRDLELKASREKERTTALQAKRERKQRLFTTAMFGVAMVFLLLVAVLLWLSRKNRKLIAKQKDQLQVSLSEKEVLLKEIHHRVKNNLQIISSLLDLQSIQMDPGVAKEALEEGKNRVQSIAILHHQLYQHDDLASVSLNGFVTELSSQVLGLLKNPEIDVVLDIEMDETLIDIDTAVPLGLILNELLTNSFKYAFSKGKEGRIEIQLKTMVDEDSGDKRNMIVYRDNGPGLPPDSDLSEAKTLGLRLISKLSKQFKGTSKYAYNNGAEFTITVP